MTTPLIELAGVRAAYGRLEVLREVSLAVARGEILALIGQNGTGKSSCLKTIFGLLRPSEGRITFDGRDITGASSAERVRLGISYVPQTSNLGRGIFPNHTVRENLDLGTYTLRDRRLARAGVERALTVFPALQGRQDVRGGLLSGGQQQMLAMSMPLTLTPRLLLLDEPTSGLSPAMGRSLMATVRGLRDSSDISILLVEQNIRLALEIADRVLVMRMGRIAREVAPQELLRAGSVFEFM